MIPSRPPIPLFRHVCTAVLLALAGCLEGLGETPGLPLVEYHELNDERAKGPVWAFAETPAGELIVGADQLLVAGGGRVERIDLAGGYAVRALAVSPGNGDSGEGEVWYGAVGDLGRLERDATGRLRAASLRGQLPPGRGATEGFWQVRATPHGVVFVGEQQVLRWNGVRMEQWALPSEPRLQPLAFAEDTVWVAQRGRGLVRLEKEGPLLAVREEELPAANVAWLLPPANAGAVARAAAPLDEGAVLGAGDAVYLRRGAQWVRQSGCDAVLAGSMPVGAARLPDGRVAVGTFLKGVAIVAPSAAGGAVHEVWGRESGLASAQVHALRVDGAGRLWIGLPEGWACVRQPGRATVFDGRNGLRPEAVRMVTTIGGTPHVVTERGVTRLGKAKVVGGDDRAGVAAFPLETVVWSAAALDDELFVGGVGGIWRLGADGPAGAAWVQERFVSADVFCLAASRRRPHRLYFTEGTSVKALEATARGWATRELGADLGDTPVSLLEDAAGDLWASTVAGGIVCYRLVDTEGMRPHLRPIAQYRPGQGVPAGTRRPQLARVGALVAAFTEEGILRAVPGKGFSPLAGTEGFVGVLAEADARGDTAHWLVARTENGSREAAQLVRVTTAREDAVALEPLDVVLPATHGRPTCLASCDGALWVGGPAGVLRVGHASALPPPGAVRWRAIHAEGKLRPIAAAFGEAVGARGGPLRFDFAVARVAAPQEAARFQTRLLPVEAEWSAPQVAPSREFAGLGAGRYRFEVRATDAMGRVGPEIGYDFGVAAAWYLRWPALAGAALLLVLLTLLGVRARLERLRRQTRRLNRMVEERTRELALANDAKSEFLANISHEIRNPLNGVSGLSAMLNEAGLSGRAAELARSLGGCARSLNRVFEDVLAFSKLELGAAVPAPRVFELGALVGDVAGVFAAQARERAVTIRIQLPDRGPWWFQGEEARLRTILENFVGNALRHAAGSPVELAVEFGEEVGGVAEVTFNVTDHGPGVPAAEQELIFRKFVRGSRARAEGATGAGLGLATCKLLAEFLGGSVGIESEPGVATTFYLRVKLARHAAPTGAASAARPSETASGAKAAGRALVVDDQEFNRLVAQRIAEQLGHRVETVGDGAAALAAFRREACALVFIDWDLPGAKGGAVARELRAAPGGAEAVIIATTAHDSDDIRRACREAGMDGFALKPFDEATIARLIDEARATHERATELDDSVFGYLARGDAGEAARLRMEYLATLDRELEGLARAALEGDHAALTQAAHRLRSHSGLVKCRSLNHAAKLLQEEPALGAAARREELVATVNARARELKARIERG